MLRLSLAVTLMLTQTWQVFAAPVYFCVSPEGVQKVDLGPDTCACHRTTEKTDVAPLPYADDSCASRGCCGNHERDVVEPVDHVANIPADASALAPSNCLCKHVPVSCTSAQLVSKSRTLLQASTMSHVGCLLVKSASLDSGSADWGLRSPLDDSGGTLHALKTIVLRC